MSHQSFVMIHAALQQVNKLCNKSAATFQTRYLTTSNTSSQQQNTKQIKCQKWKKSSNIFSSKIKYFTTGYFHRSFSATNTPSRKAQFSTFPPDSSLDTDLDQVAELIKHECNHVLVMAGAGLSTPSGIPDFRSPESGIYDNLKKYHLPYPEAIFDIDYYRGNPQPFNTWSKEYLPGVNYKPSIGHYFVRILQDQGKLLRHFTQNIDGLELLAGVREENIVAAHGSFSTASCIYCKRPSDFEEVKTAILNDETPHCKECGGLVKPDIVFFGEMLPERFWTLKDRDTNLTDCLICIGTSLEVYPFAGIADSVPNDTPRLLINRDLVGSFGTRHKDHHLSGDLVKSIELLVDKLGWTEELKEYCKT